MVLRFHIAAMPDYPVPATERFFALKGERREVENPAVRDVSGDPLCTLPSVGFAAARQLRDKCPLQWVVRTALFVVLDVFKERILSLEAALQNLC